MHRQVVAALAWVFLSRRPSWSGDWLALATLPLLLLLGTLALTWPWWTAELPRLLLAGANVVQSAVQSAIQQLASLMPKGS